jgi:hypothetical protein
VFGLYSLCTLLAVSVNYYAHDIGKVPELREMTLELVASVYDTDAQSAFLPTHASLRSMDNRSSGRGIRHYPTTYDQGSLYTVKVDGVAYSTQTKPMAEEYFSSSTIVAMAPSRTSARWNAS